MKNLTLQGRSVSQIALGSTNFGEPMSIEESWQVMDYARSVGVNMFDTARVYGEWYKNGGRTGYCEKVLGDYMKARGCRDEIFLVTKGAHPPLLDRFQSRLTAECLRSDLEESLVDLGTDHVDLYFLHRDHDTMNMAEVMEQLHEFVQEGKVRAIGASNWRFERIMEANAYAKEHGLTPFTASQIEWSMAKFDESGNSDATQMALKPAEYEQYKNSGLLLMCFTAQASGLFSKAKNYGGYDELVQAGRLGKYKDPANKQRVEAALELCEKYNVSPAALTISYLTSQGFPVMPILGCSKLSQLQDSLSAPDLAMSAEDYEKILQGDVI
ncbi:MAG: aldo/keto reductase [Firmicutes bacterium]|nr:aldo/keto reductase [Bacillota bacterium]